MSDESPEVPRALRVTAAWSWRLLVILALVAAVVAAMVRLEVLFVALFVAMLLTALLEPVAAWLRRHRVPHVLATAVVLIGAVALFAAAIYLIGRSVFRQIDELTAAVTAGVAEVQRWAEEQLGLTGERLSQMLDRITSSFGSEGGSGIGASVFGVASTAAEVVGGAGVALFSTIFFVHDGAGIWRWATRLFPASVRPRVDEGGRLSWQTLSSYARGTVLIAAIDGLGIGLGAALIGVPLAAAIAALVFFASFIPIVGALLSGMVAVLIALATQGVTGALLMFAIVIGVQQLEGHVLQPMIQGRFVAIHPLAVVLAVAGGSMTAGIVGAVIAVPIVAVANVLVRYAARVARGEGAEQAVDEVLADESLPDPAN